MEGKTKSNCALSLLFRALLTAEEVPAEEEKTNLSEETGATMIEYAMLAALIAVVAVAAVSVLGVEVTETFSTVGSGFVPANN